FIDSGLWEGGLDRSTRKQFSPLRARSTRRKRIRFRCLCELRVLRGEKYLQRVAARRNLSTLDPKLNITAHSTTAHPVFSTGTGTSRSFTPDDSSTPIGGSTCGRAWGRLFTLGF